MVTYRAGIIPNHLQGRVIGAYRVFVWGTIPLGTGLGGFCLQRFGIDATIRIVFLGTATVCALASLNRNIRNATTPAAGQVV
ncbi:MAG TPA: hypothetical protein VG815_19665 [Chloroflexota bacterium]|jgi:hypothetical protein|nr:hypothetical protein [Chloroflexota bacterium]